MGTSSQEILGPNPDIRDISIFHSQKDLIKRELPFSDFLPLLLPLNLVLQGFPVACVKQTIIIFQCWETYVGQELYKLVIMDFIVVVAVTFGAEFPRR